MLNYTEAAIGIDPKDAFVPFTFILKLPGPLHYRIIWHPWSE